MTETYCVKCRRKTSDVKPYASQTSTGRGMMKSSCSGCGSKKSRFVKGSVGSHRSHSKRGSKKGGGPIASLLANLFPF